jgi:hypothetical protein
MGIITTGFEDGFGFHNHAQKRIKCKPPDGLAPPAFWVGR